MLKETISEKEFDKLPEQTQMYYLFCCVCSMFYLKDEIGPQSHICN